MKNITLFDLNRLRFYRVDVDVNYIGFLRPLPRLSFVNGAYGRLMKPRDDINKEYGMYSCLYELIEYNVRKI